MTQAEPKYQPGQKVKITHSWAKELPPQIIDNAVFDEHWNCYTYALIGAALRIEEYELEPIEARA